MNERKKKDSSTCAYEFFIFAGAPLFFCIALADLSFTFRRNIEGLYNGSIFMRGARRK
jgi:hypothetical protein